MSKIKPADLDDFEDGKEPIDLTEADEPEPIEPPLLSDSDGDAFDKRIRPHLNQNPECYRQFYDRITYAAQRILNEVWVIGQNIEKPFHPSQSKKEWFRARKSELRLAARRINELRQRLGTEEKSLWFFRDVNPFYVEGTLLNPDRFDELKRCRAGLREIFDALTPVRHKTKTELAKVQTQIKECRDKLEPKGRKPVQVKIVQPDATEVEWFGRHHRELMNSER